MAANGCLGSVEDGTNPDAAVNPDAEPAPAPETVQAPEAPEAPEVAGAPIVSKKKEDGKIQTFLTSRRACLCLLYLCAGQRDRLVSRSTFQRHY